MRLNSTKSVLEFRGGKFLGFKGGKFLGFMLKNRAIEVNVDKCKASST